MPQFACSQFVFAKFVSTDESGNKLDASDFCPVAATEDLADDVMRSIQRKVSIGSDPALDNLDAFFLSGPMNNDLRALAHYKRSREKAPGRNYYPFIHFILIKSDVWRELTTNIASVVRPNLSEEIYRTYELQNRQELKTQRLDSATLPHTKRPLEDNLKDVQYFLSGQRKGFLSILDGILEYESVAIKGFPDDLSQKVRLLQAIHALLPPTLVDELSFATQVYQNPQVCYVRLKFLAANVALAEDYLKNTLVIDWQKATAHRQSPSSYSMLIAEAADEGDSELSKIIELLTAPNLYKLPSKASRTITPANGSSKTEALHISTELAAAVERALGLARMVRELHRNRKLPGSKIFDLLLNTPQEHIELLSPKDLEKLISEIVIQALQKDLGLCPAAVSCLCRFIEKLERIDFWNGLAPIFVMAPSKNANEFVRQCGKGDCFKISDQAKTQLQTWVYQRADRIVESSSQEALSLVQTLEDAGLSSSEDSRVTYFSLFKKVASFEILAAILGIPSLQISNLYSNLLKQPKLESLLQGYPNTHNLIRYLAGGTIERVDKAYEQVGTELSKQTSIYHSLIQHSVSLRKADIFSEHFFALCLDSEMFKKDGAEWLLDILHKGNYYALLDGRSRGACAYLVWHTFAPDKDQELRIYFSACVTGGAISREFVHGFVTLASSATRSRDASAFLLDYTGEENRLQVLIWLIEESNVPSTVGLIVQKVDEECKRLTAEKHLDTAKVSAVLELATRHSSIAKVAKDFQVRLLKPRVTALFFADESQLKESAQDLANLIQVLRRARLHDSTIADQIIELREDDDLDAIAFANRFVHTLNLLKNKLEPQIAARYAQRIIESGVLEKLPVDVQDNYKQFKGYLPSGPLVGGSRVDRQTLGEQIRGFKHNTFVQDFERWDERTEDNLVSLLSEYWHPRDIDTAKDLFTTLEGSSLSRKYLQRAKASLMKDQINCPPEVRFDYMVEIFRGIAALAEGLKLIDVKYFPLKLDPTRRQDLIKILKQLRTDVFSANAMEDEISLSVLLDTLGDYLAIRSRHKEDLWDGIRGFLGKLQR